MYGKAYEHNRLRPATPMHHDKNWLPWQCPLRDRKANFRFTIYSHSSTNPENLAKIHSTDFEIIGLPGIAEILF